MYLNHINYPTWVNEVRTEVSLFRDMMPCHWIIGPWHFETCSGLIFQAERCSSRLNLWALQMGPLCCHKMLEMDYPMVCHHILEEQKPQLHQFEKSKNFRLSFFTFSIDFISPNRQFGKWNRDNMVQKLRVQKFILVTFTLTWNPKHNVKNITIQAYLMSDAIFINFSTLNFRT